MASTYLLSVSIEATPAAPYTGPIKCEVSESVTITPLSGGTKKVLCQEITIAAGGTAVISPWASDDVFGNAAAMDLVQMIDIEADAANPDGVTVEASVSNGWTALVPTGTLRVNPGCGVNVRALTTGIAASGTDHELTLTNLDGSNPATVTITMVGTDT